MFPTRIRLAFPCLACGRDAAKSAVAAEQARIRAAVEGLPVMAWSPVPLSRRTVADSLDAVMVIDRAAVLAILDREDTDA